MVPNEIGTAPGRGRPVIARETADKLSQAAGQQIELPKRAVATSAPQTCPACGHNTVMWGCDSAAPDVANEHIHPFLCSEQAAMADTFLCRTCDAGWVQPDDDNPSPR